MLQQAIRTTAGRPLPLGAVPGPDGIQFSIFSRHATAVSLLLFEAPEDAEPYSEIPFDPQTNRTGDLWHLFVQGLGAGTYYLYRVDGPWDPLQGHRFNPHRALIDPYAKALTGSFRWNLKDALGHDPSSPRKDLVRSERENWSVIPKCIVIDDVFDWQGDRPLNYPLRFSTIYETHVRGLTIHPSSGAEYPGTYRGVIEMIPYFKELGITSLEFLPIQEFDENENINVDPETGKQLTNYWGYSTVAFFAPKASYASSGTLGGQVTEFKEMVRELHKAGIEVILDIVFNHTAEGNERGPTFSFRGLDNRIYYLLEGNRRFYRNFSGVGNTLNCNHPMVRSFILDCLRYWVVEMHVDGFRFDLGSILGRDRFGNLMENPPVLERIAEDPVLRNTKIIAEAWDAAGAYQVGWFPGGRWAEWNDRFRDDVRRFWRGDDRMVKNLATRITGSSDLYLRDGRKPFHSINFVTSHDGFTLNDLVSYERKHNERNGERNRDGNDANWSANNGVEGPAADPEIEALRKRLVKNYLATLLLSLGTPMLLGGDEFRRSQAGNNNAYCQDNELSWYDWRLRHRHAEVFRFCRKLLEFRRRHPALHRPEFFQGKDTDYNRIPDITWYDEKGKEPAWEKADHLLALRLDGSRAEIIADRDDNDFFIMFNASSDDISFTLCPAPSGKSWYRAIDTSLPMPDDVPDQGKEIRIADQDSYLLPARSMAVLISR